jgi:hypothetical protein
MNLLELQQAVNDAVDRASEDGANPEDVVVSIQIDDVADPHHGYVQTDQDIELSYDGDCQASGCVLHGWKEH